MKCKELIVLLLDAKCPDLDVVFRDADGAIWDVEKITHEAVGDKEPDDEVVVMNAPL